MRRTAILAAALAALGLAPAAEAQKKHKDEVLHQYLINEFAELNAKLNRLAERIAAVETQMGRVQQTQTETTAEVRSTQTTVKTMDTSLSTFRLSTQQDLLGLKTDLTQIRQDLARMAATARTAAQPAPAAPAPTPAAETTGVEGFITGVTESDVTFTLGSGAGVRVGTEYSVFKASDPYTEVGIVEVTQVIDANNSRAKIVYTRPTVKLEFSDIVRPRS